MAKHYNRNLNRRRRRHRHGKVTASVLTRCAPEQNGPQGVAALGNSCYWHAYQASSLAPRCGYIIMHNNSSMRLRHRCPGVVGDVRADLLDDWLSSILTLPSVAYLLIA